MEKYSYLLLFLSVSIMLGYTYSLDTPEALEIPLRNPPYNFSTTSFNLMYFFTFLAVGLFCIPIGVLVDRLSMKITIMGLLFLSFSSQFITALMFEFTPSFFLGVIMVMRAIFGMAGQGLYSLQCTVISIYGQKDYEIIMGFGLSAPFIFDALNAVVTPAVYDATLDLPLTWYIGSVICVYSILAGVYLLKKIIKEGNNSKQQQNIEESAEELEETKNKENKGKKKQGYLKEIKQLNSGFWVIAVSIFFFESSLGPVNDNLNQLLVARFGISYTDAGKLLLIHFTLLPFISAFFGYALRKKPSIRRTSIVISSLLYALAHLAVYLLPNTSKPQYYHYVIIVIFLVILSMNFTVYYVSLTAAISFMVEEEILGTAWGIAASMVGFSQCLVPLAFIGIIDSNSDLSVSYKSLSLFTTSLAVIPFLLALWILFRDYSILDIKLSDALENKLEDSLISDSNSNKLEQDLLTRE